MELETVTKSCPEESCPSVLTSAGIEIPAEMKGRRDDKLRSYKLQKKY